MRSKLLILAAFLSVVLDARAAGQGDLRAVRNQAFRPGEKLAVSEFPVKIA